MKEKEQIEISTAEGFLRLYNELYGSNLEIVALSDSPDVRCRDQDGNVLYLEITLIQDRDKDIQALLGRSDHKSVRALEEHVDRVTEGKEKPIFSSLSENVCENAAFAINKKLLKRYGRNTALIVRDTSGCDWEWDEIADQLRAKLNLDKNHFDKGIWILNFSRSKMYSIG